MASNKKTTIRLLEDTKEKLKKEASEKGITMNALINLRLAETQQKTGT